jgi:hypothetical protein
MLHSAEDENTRSCSGWSSMRHLVLDLIPYPDQQHEVGGNSRGPLFARDLQGQPDMRWPSIIHATIQQ